MRRRAENRKLQETIPRIGGGDEGVREGTSKVAQQTEGTERYHPSILSRTTMCWR